MSVPPTEEKREVLVDCALLVAAAVIKWDLDTFEKRCTFQNSMVINFTEDFLACTE